MEHVSDAFDRGPGGTQAVVLDADVTEDGVNHVHRERAVVVSDGEVWGVRDHLQEESGLNVIAWVFYKLLKIKYLLFDQLDREYPAAFF